eukprot:gene26599-34835_t
MELEAENTRSPVFSPTAWPTRGPVTSAPTRTAWPTRSPATSAPITSAPSRTAWPTKSPDFFLHPTQTPWPTKNPNFFIRPTSQPTLQPTYSPTLNPTTSSPTLESYASYTQYPDRLRINFDVTLRTSTIYGDHFCISVPTAYAFTSTYYQAFLRDTTSTNWLSDLEIYFQPTSEYIGSDYAGFASKLLVGWPGSFSGSSITPKSTGNVSISISSGFNQICFANNCVGGCTSSTNYINEFAGYIDLNGIYTIGSSISTASYTQYSDRLRINFDRTHVNASTYYQALIHDTSPSNKISDLEIYFPSTGQYFGNDVSGFATNQLAQWPDSYVTLSTSSVDSTKQLISLSGGFNQVCFANNCNDDCSKKSNFVNEFVGYIDLYGVSTVSANYTQYSDRLRIDFDVNLRTSTIYGDHYCISVPTTRTIGTTYYEASILDTTTINWISDLEIYFQPTGSNSAGFASSHIADWPGSFSTSSTSPKKSGIQSISLSSGFNQILPNVQLLNLPLNAVFSYFNLATSSPTIDSYTQYTDRLRIDFDVNLRTSTINGTKVNSLLLKKLNRQIHLSNFVNEFVGYIDKCGVALVSASYTRINFDQYTKNTFNCSDLLPSFNVCYFKISELEIYCPSNTGQYIASGYAGFASTKIAAWPDSYPTPTTKALNSTKQSASLSGGFNDICFANNCNDGCSLSSNFDFAGYNDRY